MVAPKDVSDGSQVLEVVDRSMASGALVDESFKLGSYAVADVDRDWNSSKSSGFGGFSKETTTTGYTFKLNAGGDSWAGICGSEAKKSSTAMLGGEASWGSTTLKCECKLGDVTFASEMKAASPSSNKKMEGSLTGANAKYEVSVVNDTDKTNLTGSPAGFRFDTADGPVGAVEVLRPGRVWLNARLPEASRPGVACIAAGMMLYVPPSDH